MKKIIFLFIFTLFLIIPLRVNASDIFTNYVVLDMESKRIFYELAKDEKKLPASTTKVMTAIVAIENSNLYDVVKVGDEILTMDGANIYVEIGESILMQDLLFGMLLRSGNDASMVIAKHTSGSVQNFVKLMNEKARELGLKNTVFNNPTGLDDFEKNYSTVNDLALIYSYAYQNKTFREIISAKTYETSSNKKSYYFNNRTKFISMYDKATGGKTGYTPSAGRVLVTSASNGDLDLVASSIGNKYGYERHISFYEDVFNNYRKYIILDKYNFKLKFNLEGKLYIKNSFSYPLSKEETEKIEKKIVFNKKKHGNVGEVLIYLEDDLIHKESIYLKEKNISTIEKLKLFFENLVD